MPLLVNTNFSSLVAQRNLTMNNVQLNKSLERMSSGLRINRAGDDAAGLTISETLRSQIRGSKVASQNAQDGVSILQIAEGTLSVVSENLQRIRELTVQAANDTNSSTQRDAIEQEIVARLNDNQRIVASSAFNGIKLLDGTALNARLQVGADANAVQNTLDITAALADTTSTAIGIFGGGTATGWLTTADVDFVDGDTARLFLQDVDNAVNAISSRRSQIGAFQNQLESVLSNLTLATENFSASESRIRDLDLAAESSQLTKYQILQQASVSILSQANQTPQLVLKLLQ